MRLEADVEAVTTTTLSLLGLVVRVDTLTQFKDDMGGERNFRLDRIRVGDRLEIRGDVDAQGNLIATRLRRRPPTTEVVLQGAVESITPPNLVIQGVAIQTNAATVFEDFSPNRPSVAQLFAELRAGMLVKVKGVVLSKTPVAMQATQVEVASDTDDDL